MAETIAGLDARTTRGRYGPFTVGGAVYVVARAAEDPRRLRMAKSTGGAFAPVGEAAAPSAALPFAGVAACRVGTLIYVAGEYLEEGNKLRDNRLRVRLWTFDTAFDTWSSPVVVADQPIADTEASSLDVVVSGGTAYVLHGATRSQKGGFLQDVALSVGAPAGPFSTQIIGPGGGLPRSTGCLSVGATGVHVFARHAPLGMIHHRFATGASLSPEHDVAGTINGPNYFYLRSVVHAGTVVVSAYGNGSETFEAFTGVDSAAPGAFSGQGVSGALTKYLASTSDLTYDPGHQVFIAGGTLAQVSIDAAGAVVFARKTGAAWPTAAVLQAAAAGRFGLSVEGFAGSLRYLWAEQSGGVFYDEHTF